jgi:hypothetical protein
LFRAMRDIPNARNSDSAEQEDHNEKNEKHFDKSVARFCRSSSGGLWSRSGRLRSGLRSGLRTLCRRRTGSRRWRRRRGTHWRTSRGCAATVTECLSIRQRSATIPAKTSHFCLLGVALSNCGAMFHASCQNRSGRASETSYFVVQEVTERA